MQSQELEKARLAYELKTGELKVKIREYDKKVEDVNKMREEMERDRKEEKQTREQEAKVREAYIKAEDESRRKELGKELAKHREHLDAIIFQRKREEKLLLTLRINLSETAQAVEKRKMEMDKHWRDFLVRLANAHEEHKQTLIEESNN